MPFSEEETNQERKQNAVVALITWAINYTKTIIISPQNISGALYDASKAKFSILVCHFVQIMHFFNEQKFLIGYGIASD